jgi:hypothetical protein
MGNIEIKGEKESHCPDLNPVQDFYLSGTKHNVLLLVLPKIPYTLLCIALRWPPYYWGLCAGRKDGNGTHDDVRHVGLVHRAP